VLVAGWGNAIFAALSAAPTTASVPLGPTDAPDQPGRSGTDSIWTFEPMVRSRPWGHDQVMTSTDRIHDFSSAGPDRPLLICYDGSEHAKHAIRSAAGLLAVKDALVVTVWQPTSDVGAFAWYGAGPNMADFPELDRAGAEAGGRVAEEGAQVAREAGLQAESIAIEATPPVWKTILDTADLHNAAAIVMGSRGLTGLRSMLLGSVSNAVVHHTDRPTLVIHHPGDDHAD
jgi:nucleotide-binding universal stress UspA family protein